MGAYAAGAGILMGLGGAFLGGRAGDIVRKRLGSIAETPGVDIEDIVGKRLKGIEGELRAASRITEAEALSRQATQNKLAESSLPGYGAARDLGMSTASSYLRGELPQDEINYLQRQSAANFLGRVGAGGGITGRSYGANEYGRNLGLRSHQLRQEGLSWLNALRGLAPMATPTSAFSLTGPTPSQAVDIRGQERVQRMNLLAQAAGIPGQTAAWANYLTNTGNQLTSLGLGTMGMGGGGGSVSNPPAGTFQNSYASFAPGSPQAAAGFSWRGGYGSTFGG